MDNDASTHKDWWSKVALDPDLTPFILLSTGDMAHLTELAGHAADPVAWLTEELHKRGRKRRDLLTHQKISRQQEDAARINDVANWPGSHLRLKTQPWVTNAEGNMRFALIHCSDLKTVIEENKAPVTFESVTEIVKIWSVD